MKHLGKSIVIGVTALSCLSCSKKDFMGPSDERSLSLPIADGSPNDQQPFQSVIDKAPDTTASEPIMVDGAYLVCFRDKNQKTSSDMSIPVGCSLYTSESASTRSNLNPDRLKIEEAFALGKNQIAMPLPLERTFNSPRWQWLGSYQEIEPATHLRLVISGPQMESRTFLSPLYDKIPAAVFLDGQEALIGPFVIKVVGTQTCLNGDPAWSYDASTGTSRSSALRLLNCSSASSFQAQRFQEGWYLHTLNPNPPIDQCRPDYGMNTSLCSRSCLDKKDFGRSPELQLWGCTTSTEAQSVKLSAKNRNLIAKMNQAWLGADLSRLITVENSELAIELEFVSSGP